MTTQTNVQTILTERSEMAKALNFGKFKVLTYDLDNEKGSTAKVEEQTRRYGVQERAGTLYRGKIKKDDGLFYLLNRSAMLTASVGVSDWLRSADDANAPVIREGDQVAILMFSKEMNLAAVEIVQALKPTPEYSTSLEFKRISREEIDLTVPR